MLRHDQNPISTPTPTVQICKIRGFSLDILGELYSKNMLTTPEIASNLDRSPKYVRCYLYNLYKYGCIDRKDRWGWVIEPFGADVLLLNNNNIDQRKKKERPKKDQRKTKETSNDSHTTVESRQLNLSLYESDPNVTEPEREVVMLMVSHYERTGEKYRYFKDVYDFCEQTGISAVGVMELLAKLKQEGVIYMREEKMLGMWKIGLKVNFIERLQYC
jgi:hypothetical protein